MPKALIFDFYGTLDQITQPKRPYHQLYHQLAAVSISFQVFKAYVMTQEVNKLNEIAEHFGRPHLDLVSIEEDISCEVESVQLYKETEEVLSHLSKHYDMYLLSNLASPYK